MKNPSKNYGSASEQPGPHPTGYQPPTYTGEAVGMKGNRGNAPEKAPKCYGGGSGGTGASAPKPPSPKHSGGGPATK